MNTKMKELIQTIKETTDLMDKTIEARHLEIAKLYDTIDQTNAAITKLDAEIEYAVGGMDMSQFTALRTKKSELETEVKSLTDYVEGLEQSIGTIEQRKKEDTAASLAALRQEVDIQVKKTAADAATKFDEFVAAIAKMYELADMYDDAALPVGGMNYQIRSLLQETTFTPAKSLDEIRRGYRPQIGGGK